MRRLLLLVLSATLFLAACDDNGNETRDASVSTQSYAGGGTRASKMMAMNESMPMPAPATAPMDYAAPPSSMVMDRTKQGDRKIAETHSLQIETEYDVLQTRFQRDYAKCVELGCQIINSNVALESGGNINARIDPDKLGAFLDFLATGDGEIKNHSVSADDYTMEYSDASASNANLIALRTRLSTLLSSRAEGVDDILRIEQELNRIQTQIDQNSARLKILEKMTDMATINLSYTVKYRPAEIQSYELKNTWKKAVQKFLMGIDRMIQFVFATLPWIPVIAVSIWLGVWILRFAFRKVSIRLPWRKQP